MNTIYTVRIHCKVIQRRPYYTLLIKVPQLIGSRTLLLRPHDHTCAGDRVTAADVQNFRVHFREDVKESTRWQHASGSLSARFAAIARKQNEWTFSV